MNDAVKDQYWEQFSVVPADLEHLANFLVESETPKTLEELFQELVAYRYQQVLDLANEALSQGRIYRPGETYAVGEKIIFPHLGNLLGVVEAVRAGRNPEFEPFSVVKVAFEDGSAREFASALGTPHPLDEATYLPVGELSLDEIYQRYGAKIKAALRPALEESPQFVAVADYWFLRDLLVEPSLVQLNIAEALLDMAQGGPLTTEALLAEMEMPAEIVRPLQVFSLEYALERDVRFDEVGPTGHALWYLQRMEPRAVLEIPAHLHYMPLPYSRGVLDEVMLSLEQHADDEWSEVAFDGPIGEQITVTLIYPHWRSGTLPLTNRLAKLFPTARLTDRVQFYFVDGETGKEFPGWVVRSGRYVYGLENWYAGYQVGVGAYVDLKPGERPGTIEIAPRRIRSRRGEWLRTVSVRDGRLHFEVTRAPVTCEFDELSAIVVPDPAAVDQLANDLRRVTLENLVEQIFSGLSVLSLQRAVHAITLYSVLNLLRRVPPAPLLDVLAMDSRYNALGDNYWAYRGED